MPARTTVPLDRPLSRHLNDALTTWSTSQRTIIGLAADFADSGEWTAAGAASAAHWIAAAADIEVCTAREWIRVGRRLRTLPVIADAFEADDLSYSKVRCLTRLATPINEAQLVAIAATVAAGQLPRALAAWLHRTSDDAELERHQHQQRSITWRIEPDGVVTFTQRLPPLLAGAFISRLTTHVMTNRPAPTSIADWPTLGQQYADAFEHMLTDGGGRLLTELVIHVRADGATLDDGTPLPLSVVGRIAPEAFIRALVHDAEGRPINASSKRRHPTTRQKRVVKGRDQRCVDCGATTLLQYDHVPDYEQTKRTVVEELQLRCSPATGSATQGSNRADRPHDVGAIVAISGAADRTEPRRRLVKRLEQRAAATGRSAEEEHRHLLRQALRPWASPSCSGRCRTSATTPTSSASSSSLVT